MLTKEDLLAACDWAERDGYLHGRMYDQQDWDCGSACCLHGAAHLIAYGEPAKGGPSDDDYGDLRSDIRAGVISVLWSPGGTPELIRRVIAREVVIGEHVVICENVVIGDRVRIGDRAVIGADVSIAANVKIGDDVVIGDYATIPAGATITRKR